MTEKDKAATAEFHREVGELVFWFAASENIIYLLANELIGGKEVGTVVMKNVHLERAIDIVRDLAKTAHPTSPSLGTFDRALLDFKDCARERNSLIHAMALPHTDGVSGKEVIQFGSVRTMKWFQKERNHIVQLREKIRECSVKFLQAGMDMGMLKKKRPHRKTAEPGVAADGATRRR
jgi:hypothetical protein